MDERPFADQSLPNGESDRDSNSLENLLFRRKTESWRRFSAFKIRANPKRPIRLAPLVLELAGLAGFAGLVEIYNYGIA